MLCRSIDPSRKRKRERENCNIETIKKKEKEKKGHCHTLYSDIYRQLISYTVIS
jgi:hypothetical protein